MTKTEFKDICLCRESYKYNSKVSLLNAKKLVKASGLTNFVYELSQPLEEAVNAINSIVSIRGSKAMADIFGRVKAIREKGVELMFSNIAPGARNNTTYIENLALIDDCMPRLLGELLKEAYLSGEMKIDKLVGVLTEKNPLGYIMNKNVKLYEAKIKRLLVDISLGMVPGTPWSGDYQATGGYLIVKETGDIICYHIYNKKTFEEYLYHNVKLETPDAGRLGFGKIYESDGKQCFALNLQIRFVR